MCTCLKEVAVGLLRGLEQYYRRGVLGGISGVCRESLESDSDVWKLWFFDIWLGRISLCT